MDQKYEALFTPWKIGNVEIKNRIVMCPMGGTSLFGWFELGGCHFDKEAAKLFIERANNNVGLIIPGIAPLRDTFWGKWLWQNPKMFEELKELCACFMDFVHKLFKFFKHLWILPKPFAPECIAKWCNTRDNKTNVIICSFNKEFCCFLIKMATAKFKPTEK